MTLTTAPRPAAAATPATEPVAPGHRPPTWRNSRFLVGAALVFVSTVLGALLLATPARHPVWAAAHDLPAGAIVRATDLVSVPVAGPTGYIGTSQVIVGKRLTRSIGTRELVPSSALGPAVLGNFRSIAVPVQDQHAPPALIAGNYVDVWVTPRDVTGALGMPFLALAAVPVSAVTHDAAGASGGPVSVVLDVKPNQASQLISGLRRGDIDLVRVPGASQ